MVHANKQYSLRFVILLLTSFPTLSLSLFFFFIVMLKHYFYYPGIKLVIDSSEDWECIEEIYVLGSTIELVFVLDRIS